MNRVGQRGWPAKIGGVKVGTPFGEYPFLFRRVERREGGVALVGTVAGLQSSLVLDREDLDRAARKLAVSLGAAVLLLYLRSRR
jgi:hypothetical protein